MTKKDLFILIIKLFGLYFLIATLFTTLPSNLSIIAMQPGWLTIILVLANALVLIGLFILLIFNASKVAGFLKLIKDLIETAFRGYQ